MARILVNEPLWHRSTFKIGGEAEKLVFPGSLKELVEWLSSGTVTHILGGGANVLISDSGLRGVVISAQEGLNNWSVRRTGNGGVLVDVQAGISLSKLSSLLMKESVAGIEFAYGIPGLLGGALIMNAGAMDGEMKDIVETVTLVTPGGKVKTIRNDQCGFAYRSSSFPAGSVITSAVLKLTEGKREAIMDRMKKNQQERKSRQPLDKPSAGSVYKNPPGDFAGRLIEEAGLKGARVGGAIVSDKHANFIINRGNAKADDVLTLMTLVEKRVSEQFGVELEREINLMGDFGVE